MLQAATFSKHHLKKEGGKFKQNRAEVERGKRIGQGDTISSVTVKPYQKQKSHLSSGKWKGQRWRERSTDD